MRQGTVAIKVVILMVVRMSCISDCMSSVTTYVAISRRPHTNKKVSSVTAGVQ